MACVSVEKVGSTFYIWIPADKETKACGVDEEIGGGIIDRHYICSLKVRFHTSKYTSCSQWVGLN